MTIRQEQIALVLIPHRNGGTGLLVVREEVRLTKLLTSKQETAVCVLSPTDSQLYFVTVNHDCNLFLTLNKASQHVSQNVELFF